MKHLAVIGGGSWGTALSIALAPRFEKIRLWVYEQDLAERMSVSRENDVYLPDYRLPPNVQVHSSLPEALDGAELVLGVMPSHHTRRLAHEIRPLLSSEAVYISATKGLETGSLLRASEIVGKVLESSRIAVLSGPTFAREVAAGDPTAVVAASNDPAICKLVQDSLSGPAFRVYTSGDPIGVEIGGAIKNVVAIGAGLCSGLGLGHNALAALITRGLAEMTRLAIAMGGRPLTLAGLAGLGDLVLTCTGDLSRNRQFGMELAKGRKAAEIAASMQMVAEGVRTTQAAVELARLHGVEMPICEQMHAVIHLGRSPAEAIRLLMERSLKEE